MTSPTMSSSTCNDNLGNVPLNNKFINRFYEPIVLLEVLDKICNKESLNAPDPPSDMSQPIEKNFHFYVNKLAQLCASEQGGGTVTAFAVLQFPDEIEYRFTSNQRTEESLTRAKNFTVSILRILGSMEGHENQSVISDILQKSLSFNRPRVTGYIKALEGRATECIDACEMEATDESRYIADRLKGLVESLRYIAKEKLNNDQFAKSCEGLIKSIEQMSQPRFHVLISNRTKEGRIDESEKWSGLRNRTGRLLSYLQAARFLVKMPKKLPELFENFRVSYVLSSAPHSTPFRGKHGPDRKTADGVIGRMTSERSKQDEYFGYAQELQVFALDESLKRMAKDTRPIVHAEVLLLDSIEKSEGTHPSVFFNNYNYIGASKPTCRLCSYYFAAHPSRVEVRPTHSNLYKSWRVPDVSKSQGTEAERRRQDLMNKVLDLVRKDTFTILKEKLSARRRYDSNTSSSYPRDSTSIGSLGHNTLEGIQELTMSTLSLNPEPWSSDDKEAGSNIVETNSFDESADEEAGGAKI